jgi:hypothetical protein
MGIYVAEIQDRAVVAFRAEDAVLAGALIDEDWFKSDLIALESEGEPVWDGVSEIGFREASTEEAAVWRKSFAQASTELRNAPVGVQLVPDWLVYLIPVTDPTDDDEWAA